jgi:hypothetical protein
MKTGIELIAEERQEQIEKHGRTIEHDVKHNNCGELIQAIEALVNDNYSGFPQGWDETICKKIFSKAGVEKLAMIGAFCAAEIDRVQYLKTFFND